MKNQPNRPATPVFRDAARDPYDVHALALSFGGSWARLVNETPHLAAAPGAGWRHMMELADMRIDVLTLRNWRNAR